ncbi:unnamed protein product [Parnassius apollo]|uniref:YLP motif-containing protein 1 n=1 Tax=Parnassius apollo TaxID=110799 RepID=A0A8S3X4G2_PARAO|nr:unnamed protein product [Parnassius apollo]
MSWPVPPPAQWNPGVAMTPNMNMGYTPDQWALMQQQNWQQWTQWQQQYAQWHSQYGDKYAEQMQAMPTMGTMPPLPPVSCVPPPAPPPPDQPPPPHQNDQPLFTQKPPPPPVPAPPQNQQTSNKSDNVNNTKTPEVDTQSWSYDTHAMDTHDDAAQNSEALEKLSEEERLFDIQFQKWEEEIEKWKKENVNHPDKQAYNEYEQKFEACRAQLLERRQQMKQKRARLMSNTSQTVNNNVTGNMPTVPAPGSNPVPLQTKIPNNYSQPNMQSQKLKNNPTVNYFNQKYPHYQQHNMSEGSYSSDTKYVEPTFRNDSYHNVGHYSTPNVDNSDFLPKDDTKGIPGLDLVPEVDKPPGFSKNQDVIDITEENKAEKQEIQSLGPDYSTISKGINSILGDEKIMNILSMVRGQKSFDNTSISKPHSNMDVAKNYQHTPNIPYGSRQNTNNVQSSFLDIPKTGNDMPVVQRQYDDKRVDISKEQYYGNFTQSIGHNMAPRNVQITASQVGPLQNQAMQNETINNFHKGSYDRKSIPEHQSCPMPTPPVRSKWVDEPLFTPSIIVEYEHKPLRLKARDFIEPVHMFDYNHKSKESDKKKDFEKEVDDLFSRQRKMEINDENFSPERSYRDLYYRDNNRKQRENIRDDYRQRGPLREAYSERHRYDDKYDNRQRDHSDNYKRREDIYRNYERGRDDNRDRYRDYRKDESRNRSRSKERENRKRTHSKDSEVSGTSSIKKGKDAHSKNDLGTAKHIVMIDDILEPPGREMRPEKIVIILRGLPGSGKSYLAKLIRDREAEHGGTVRIMSIDDYFMQEGEIEVNDPVTGKMVKKPSLKYEYDQDSEEAYMYSLKRAFKRSLTDGYFSFLIFDAVNEQLKSYADIWNFARQNGFQVYICTLEVDLQTCYKRNIHNRTLEDIEVIRARFFPTPAHHIQLDPTTLLQSAAITEVQMEDVDNGVSMEEDPAESEVENHFTSKWEKMDDAVQLARLDGTSKPLRPSQLSMEDYLQIDDWQPNVSKPGKKTVRWADIEERRKQEKMRAIGFVVGQTDWNRMTDPTMGSSALTQTKYIERVRRM